ncbi:MAG: proprotein convertase P-domain-containing protein [Verrucomicrobia bacterium]|nr:proprotein convertase P-domain-containing protein [Verrucomicrobiota bacterium]
MDTIRGGNGQDVLIGGATVDWIDGGAEEDLIIGDNAVLDRVPRVGNFTNSLFQTLAGARIYDDLGTSMVDGVPRNEPDGAPVWGDFTLALLDHSFVEEATPGSTRFGDDYLAGGPDDDRIFGGLGHDIIQGDGSIDLSVWAARQPDGTLQVAPSAEAASDGNDYIEGNGGNDVIFGGLGQDDIIGGSSEFFGLTTRGLRPDGSDLIFGGAGTDLQRNHSGDTANTGHSRDADTILGDNGNIVRLVGTNGVATNTYVSFNYDNYSAAKIVARAVHLLDYTWGGVDFDPTSTANDNGAPDEAHGESGDDSIYGQTGDDVLFGEGQDDDILGGYGDDWISGGTGQDGVLGDDGRIYTSRNSGTIAEPLYGISTVALNEYISTPGKKQESIIHAVGELKKTFNLTPFNVDDPSSGMQDNLHNAQDADDIIYGGLGDDFLHGGAGDNAISGAEALPVLAALVFPDDGTTNVARLDGVVVIFGYDSPLNIHNVLGFAALRAEEFGAYDEFNPRERIMVEGYEYFLNFDAADAGAPQVGTMADGSAVYSDGDDRIFGDLGNDWLVGGTGEDHLYGGRGNDLMNADDDLGTNGGLNDGTDTHATYEDIAFGGAGRDVLLANTGGDRLIDWAGEFNSYIVPFSAFGAMTVSRTLQPHLMEYLYDLSESDGADPTRSLDTGASALRNGEPEGELGLVLQKDLDWHAQTGAPDDPQPGNIPGGPRDVLRGADFNNGNAGGFSPDTGTWIVGDGRLEIVPDVLGGDAVSVFDVDELLPTYFEVQATINAGKPTGGYKSNAYIIFDYYDPADFKFAGVNVSNDKLEMGHRDATGWHVDVLTNIQAKPDKDYNMLLAINGLTATLVIDNSEVFTHAFAPRVDADGFSYGLNMGMVGIGANNSKSRIDNVAVQVLPPEITFQSAEDFSDGVADLQGAPSPEWQISAGRYNAMPPGINETTLSTSVILVAPASLLELEATLSTGSIAGFAFDIYGPEDFKFAALSTGTDQVIIGHYTARHGWTVDAAAAWNLVEGTDYELSVSLKGLTVSAFIGEQAVVGHAFNGLTVDGEFGLIARSGAASYDQVTIRTNDPALEGLGDEVEEEPPAGLIAPVVDAVSATPDPVTAGNSLTLTAAGVSDSDGIVVSVAFYRDSNGNGILDESADALIGTDTNDSDGWSVSSLTDGFVPGPQTYFAQAVDNDGLRSTPVSVIGQVAGAAPTVGTYFSADAPKSIPGSGLITSTLVVADSISILDLNVQLNIEHDRDSDLDVFLISPSGTRVELFTDVGGGGKDFANTILDDEAAPSIQSGAAPFAGTFRPEGNLSLFDGENAFGGVWILEITDDQSGKSGTLNGWSISIEHL